MAVSRFGRFQSTCPARGTTYARDWANRMFLISIHVPREGHDADTYHDNYLRFGISIHVPREGHDVYQ